MHFQYKGTEKLNRKRSKKTYCAITKPKNTSVVTVTANEVEFQTGSIARDREINPIKIKSQEITKILNMCMPNSKGSKTIKQILTTAKGEVEKSVTVVKVQKKKRTTMSKRDDGREKKRNTELWIARGTEMEAA